MHQLGVARQPLEVAGEDVDVARLEQEAELAVAEHLLVGGQSGRDGHGANPPGPVPHPQHVKLFPDLRERPLHDKHVNFPGPCCPGWPPCPLLLKEG